MVEYVKRIRELVGSDELLQVPSVSVAVRDGSGRVMLARHANRGEWVVPGGAIEPGEVPEDAARREMLEETGLHVTLTRFVGVFGGPDFIVHYANGDRTSYVMSLYEARIDGDAIPKLDADELLEVRFVTSAEAKTLDVARWVPHMLRVLFEKENACDRDG